ncbi:MAG: cbb3-type cytochrome c oxidase subunit II [Opitutaceae bacterium]
MNNGPLLFLGLFVAIAFSWTGIVVTNLVQQTRAGASQPFYDAATESAVPAPMPGLARQGQAVYQDLGCVYCHSQQVRNALSLDPAAESPDVARGWGNRPNVARDYIYDGRLFLGTMRTGPDLRNIGQRNPSLSWQYNHLYNPQITSKGSIMPPHAFLFDVREIKGEPSPKALTLPPEYAPPEGCEVVPTARAEALVAYLLSLRTDYTLPEAPGGAE